MSKIKIGIIILSVLLTCTAEAFTKTVTRYVQRVNSCTAIQSDDDCATPGLGCLTIDNEQIYRDQLDEFTCANPLGWPD